MQEVLSGLPVNLPAALFVVIHMPPIPTDLTHVLSRSSTLPVLGATQGQAIQCGNVYVARPDNHLFIENDKILLWHGPKESRHRPSINALFRSAAVNYAQRTVGLILSGTLDDGTTGLWWIQRHGGIVIVQDPSEAQFNEMPQNALDYVDADYVLRLKEIPSLLVELANGSNPETVRSTGT